MKIFVIALVVMLVPLSMYAYIYLMKAKSLIPDGGKIIEDVVPSLFDVSKLKLARIIKENGSRLKGEEMRQRAVALNANLGFADGERMLAQQKQIPPEFQGFYILLPGAIMRDARGVPRIPFLVYVYIVGVWHMDFLRLDSTFGDDDCFACAA